MDYAYIVPLLALGTMLAVLIFALVSKARVEKLRRDPNAPTSTLAKDGPEGGVDLLKPGSYRPAAASAAVPPPPRFPPLR